MYPFFSLPCLLFSSPISFPIICSPNHYLKLLIVSLSGAHAHRRTYTRTYTHI
jgi:hypothetical protein